MEKQEKGERIALSQRLCRWAVNGGLELAGNLVILVGLWISVMGFNFMHASKHLNDGMRPFTSGGLKRRFFCLVKLK
ncbi:hypothetical protein CO172_00170 [Candidatus Uhrbacteria bacterium CG_4_9_14_3_um_filter_36_7]|uniref:Uncharacterized protein n=1 Tax=Candidatus Uhrbacteria bacterium CG_4_9_14_3_um_filter_36_7 TaxID=1975033 RepID=A0A2M7XII7_9BACT|nr:MAG: hypothetical protein CO172_00170 [Candidatus Uhrbacteria bacterium CG_4_9_14_3_um_filter_36_7]